MAENTVWNRVILICKPEQSGKTFIMIQSIIKDMKYMKDTRDTDFVVNIILCDNNLLLTKQTGSRVGNDLEEFQCNGENYIEFSSHKRTKYHDACSVAGAIATKEISNVLCCTNSIRIDDIYTVINDINKSKLITKKIYWKIWLDEADKWLGFISSTFKPLLDKFANISVYCITATPKPLFDRYKWMNVLPLEKTTTEQYHGWKDNDIHLIDASIYNLSAFELIEHVFKNIAISKITPGSKWFVPGSNTRKSHYKVKDIALKYGFVVFTVNGDGLSLFLQDKQSFIFPKDMELNTMLKNLYKKYGLEKYPVLITGNICIGRGISIMSNDFMIDYAILSIIASKQEVSQISGRLKGNIKHWENYKVPVVYTTPQFDKIATEWEKKSRNLAELAYKKQCDGDITIIKRSELKTLGEDFEYIKHSLHFNKYKDAQEFLLSKSREMRYRKKITKSGAIKNCNDFLVSTRLESIYGKKKDELMQSDRLTLDQANDIVISFGISSNKGTRYLVLPIYDTMESTAKQVKFEVRYISFKS